jgi:putative membrane protein
MMWGYGYGWQGMLWMGLGSLFWLVLLGLSIWLLVRWLTRNSHPATPWYPNTPPSPSAMEILRQRYARGEMDTETFQAMRAHLEETRVGGDRLQRV